MSVKAVPLEDLLRSIIEHHSSDHIKLHLERNDLSLRPMDTAAEIEEEILIGLRRLCIARSPRWVLSEVCSKPGLIAMIRSQSSDKPNQDLTARNMAELARLAVEVFALPILDQCFGPRSIRNKLYSYKDRIAPCVSRLRQRREIAEVREALRGINVGCWTYLEELFKQLLGFYALHFGRFASSIAAELSAALEDSCRVEHKSLGRVVEAFREVEFIFQTGESRRQQKKRSANSQVVTHEGQHAFAQRLQQECMEAFGRASPFRDLPLDEYQALISQYRNPFAHDTIETLIAADPSGEQVWESISLALNLVDSLIRREIAPRLVFPVAEGSDAYGRRMMFYAEEGELTEEAVPTDLRHCYPSVYEPVQPFSPCLLMESGGVGQAYHPPIYSYKAVVSYISGQAAIPAGSYTTMLQR